MMSLCPFAISPTQGRLPLDNAKPPLRPNHLSSPNSARHKLGCPGTSLPISCASPKTHAAGATGKKRGRRKGLESGQAPGLPYRTSWARWGWARKCWFRWKSQKFQCSESWVEP